MRAPVHLVEQLQAGDTIPIALEQLGAAEDAIIRGLLVPDGMRAEKQALCEANWAMRPRLLDELRGAHFNGNVLGITMRLAEGDPLETAIAASKLGHYTIEQAVAIDYAGTIRSSSPGIHGDILRTVWYVHSGTKSNGYKTNHLWRRSVGDDRGDNTIQEVSDKLRRHGVLDGSKVSKGTRTGNRRR